MNRKGVSAWARLYLHEQLKKSEFYYIMAWYFSAKGYGMIMYQGIDLEKIDINAEPPMEERARQYYYMAKCREWVREFERKNGLRLTAFIQTFGCPFV